MKFDKLVKALYKSVILEAGEEQELPPMPDDAAGGGGGDSGPELNLPDLSELEGDQENGEGGAQEARPEEYELAKLAIKTLEAAAGIKLNPAVFADFEKGVALEKVLNYVEKKVNEKAGVKSYDNPKFYEALGIKNLKGMSIGQKMHFFRNSSLPAELQLDGQRRHGWARIILNAARYGYRDFAIDFVENKMNNLELESLYQQLATDLSFDARGSDFDIPDKI